MERQRAFTFDSLNSRFETRSRIVGRSFHHGDIQPLETEESEPANLRRTTFTKPCRYICQMNHYVMKAYRKVQIWLHASLTSAEGGGKRSALCLGHCNSGEISQLGGAGPKVSLDPLEKRHISCQFRESNRDSSVA